jgi:tRNA-(MS[2]IO[6]A)-hydroxylase (MiaE)-like
VVSVGRGRPRAAAAREGEPRRGRGQAGWAQALWGRRGAASKEQRVDRVNLGDLRPDPFALLGQTAYLELSLFEAATSVAGRASDLEARETLTRVAGVVLQQHHDLVDLLTQRGLDAAASMKPYATEVERYRRRLGDSSWHESVLTLHLTAGLLDDFFARLAQGLPDDLGDRVGAVLSVDIGHEALTGMLKTAIAADPRLSSKLALWGRRVVGDTLLVARIALAEARTADGAPTTTDAVRVEPILTDLIAAHTRRMDSLGLTA